jgi:hypothetical protein
MKRRGLFSLAAGATAFVAVTKAEVDVPVKLVAAVIPAPPGSIIQGPAVLDQHGNRVGQLVYRVRT